MRYQLKWTTWSNSGSGECDTLEDAAKAAKKFMNMWTCKVVVTVTDTQLTDVGTGKNISLTNHSIPRSDIWWISPDNYYTEGSREFHDKFEALFKAIR